MIELTIGQRQLLIRMRTGLDAGTLTGRELVTCDALVRQGLARLEVEMNVPSIYCLTDEGIKQLASCSGYEN